MIRSKLREALQLLIENIEMRRALFGLNVIVDTKTFLDAKAALSEPLRNCDVGTDKEQAKRFEKFCKDNQNHFGFCNDCPIADCPRCELTWGQMPYDPVSRSKEGCGSNMELKPCPFCGSKASIHSGTEDHWVLCQNKDCFAGLISRSFSSAEEAATAWNRRIE